MTKREVQAEARRLERTGWVRVQIRVEHGPGRRVGYGLTAIDPATGRTGGPWWATEAERIRGE